MKSITLLINDEEKVFQIPFVNGMVLRKFIEMKTRMDMSNLTPEELDEMVGLVVYAYKNKFTLEEFYEGVPHDQVMALIDELFLPTPQKGKSEDSEGKK